MRWRDLRSTLVRKLGAGSSGQVYEAYFMGAPVAVKILNTVDASGAGDRSHPRRAPLGSLYIGSGRVVLSASPVYAGVALTLTVTLHSLQSPYRMDCFCAELDLETLQKFKQEVDLQRKLSMHPNIVRFLGACCPALQRNPQPADLQVRWRGMTTKV